MHIIYIYTYHHQRWISNKCRLYKCFNDYFEHRNDRCRKIYFYTENKWKEKERVGHGFCFILAQIQGCTRSRERRLARSEIQPPTTFTSGRKRKKKGEGDRDESIRAWRETETVNYRTGTRQSREPVGRTSSRINRAKSIVRYICWKGWTVEQKKGKKKGDARDKKTGFRLEIKLFIVSPFRGHCGETINGNKIRLIARKSSPVRRFRFISDDDLTRFQNLFRISPFFFPSFFFIFNFFLLSFFLLHYVFRRRS